MGAPPKDGLAGSSFWRRRQALVGVLVPRFRAELRASRVVAVVAQRRRGRRPSGLRRLCRAAAVSRSTVRYKSVPEFDAGLMSA